MLAPGIQADYANTLLSWDSSWSWGSDKRSHVSTNTFKTMRLRRGKFQTHGKTARRTDGAAARRAGNEVTQGVELELYLEKGDGVQVGKGVSGRGTACAKAGRTSRHGRLGGAMGWQGVCL